MKFFRESPFNQNLAFTLVLLIITGFFGNAQTTNIGLNGKVLDAKSKTPLEGATVKLKGTTHQILTGKDGSFEFITGQTVPVTYLISYVGYAPTEVVVNQALGAELLLEPATNQLDEVVLVGYGEKRKKTAAGAVSSISPKDINDIPVAGLDQLLQGQATGVLATANTSVPGSKVFLRVRGSTSINASNDPLYVIDGVFVSNTSMQSITTGGQQTSPLADLNPDDIQSIEILKDANSTAIYGSRGANGVILITTKRGKLNTRSKINIGYYHAISEARKFWPTLTGEQEGILQNETWLNDGRPFATRPFRPRSEGGLGLPEEQVTVDRVGLVFQKAPTHNFDASFSGGDAKTSYYVGGNFFQQEAIVKPDMFQRTSARINIDHQLRDKLKIGVSVNGIATNRRMSPNNNVPHGAVNGALYTPTYFPLFLPDGSYNRPSLFENPLAAINEIKFDAIGVRAIGNIYGEYQIKPGFKFKSSWSIDYHSNKEDNFFNSKMQLGQPPINGIATSAVSNQVTLIAEQILTYSKDINNKHYLNFLGGNTVQKESYQLTSTTGTGFPTDQFSRIASAAVQTGTSTATEAGLLSFFGRASYTYNRKYTLDLDLRADGSSRFGTENRWGYFPAAGVSWVASREKFIDNLNIFSDLKFKASFGFTGNQEGIPDFASRGLWSGGNTYLDIAGIAPNQLANPNLKWETTRQFNAGTEFSFFDGKLGFDFNFYRKYTTDLLLQLPVPGQLGFSSIFANAAEMSNTGIELAVHGDIINRKNFIWNASFSLSTNKNKVEKLETPILKTNGQGIIQEGLPLFSFYVHKQLGVNPDNGNVLFDDVNKDGWLTNDDLQVVGNAWPEYFGSFTNDFILFKNFDIKAFVYYSYGNKIWNNTRYRMGHGGSRNGVFAQQQEQLQRWQKPGDITMVPRMTASGNNASIIPSRFLEDGSFLRLRSLSLGYTFPKELTNKWNISALRFYAMATNLITITNYSGVDPEVNTVGNDDNVLGYDQAIAPQPRTLQVGFNITF